MPIYEYRCQACGHELEKLQRISDPVLKDCPHCGKAKLRRLISAAGFRLKGAGWYETDFKQGNKRNLAESHTAKTESAAESSGSGSAGSAGGESTAAKSDGASPGKSTGGAASESTAGKAKSAGSGASESA